MCSRRPSVLCASIILVSTACIVACSRKNETPARQAQSVERTYDAPLDKITGFKKPDNIASVAKTQDAFAASLLKEEDRARSAYIRKNPHFGSALNACSADAASFDWRQSGRVTDVKDQGLCSACWAFATDAAFEGSMIGTRSEKINASEQELLSCSNAGDCTDGFWAFQFLVDHGTTTKDAYDYTGRMDACRPEIPTPLRAAVWKFVRRDGGIPTAQELKDSLCAHGPIAVGITATDALRKYTKKNDYDFSKPFNEHSSAKTNHAIVIIGWDNSKHAWLIKNSWGSDWGIGGFGWVDYDSNQIGDAAAWVDVPPKEYSLPPRYYSVVMQQSAALEKQKPDWEQNLDWSMNNRDAGGSVDCQDRYLSTYPECMLRGGRSCIMEKAISSAKAGDCENALRSALITQCHNPKAAQQIQEAGAPEVCSYLKTK